MSCISNVINKIKLPMSERSKDVLKHIQIMASWRITCEDKRDHRRFYDKKRSAKRWLRKSLILKLYLNNPHEDKAPLPNGTNTAMINQNSYIKKNHEKVIFRKQTEWRVCLFKNWSYPLDKKWKMSRILSCPSKFLKRESHKQKSYKFHKKNSADIYTYVCQKMISIDEHHQQKVKNKLATELWLNAHPFHEWVTAKLQP